MVEDNISSAQETDDHQLRQILQYLQRSNVCSHQKALSIWQLWLETKHRQPCRVADFLQSHGVSAKVLQSMTQRISRQACENAHTRQSDTDGNTTPETNDIRAKNEQLAKQLRSSNLVAEEVLQRYLEHCNRNNVNLGQSLVRQRYLTMTALTRLMQSDSPQSSDCRPAGRGITGSEFGAYQILEEIARGGMGIVYRARQKGIERIVALKVLISGEAADETQIQRFFREARATAIVKHPNIIPIYDCGKINNYHYFTMKYVDGGTFQQVIDSDQPLEKKIAILIKSCQALHQAHENNILHRDIKPSNILLDQFGEPYVTDFGLAKFIDSNSALTQTGTALGTPYYMSPEQAKGEKRKIDRRSDVYSLGVILYQMITRQLPFTADKVTELYKKIVEDEPLRPRKYDRNIAPGLEAICLKSIDKNRELRYQSAEEMAQDLITFQAGQRVQAQKINMHALISRWKRRYHRTAVVALSRILPVIVVITLAICGMIALEKHRKLATAQAHMQIKLASDKAVALCDAGEYRQALTLLEDNARQFGNEHQLLTQIAQIYQRLEKYDQARAAFSKATKLAPDDDGLLYKKSLFHEEIGEYRHALKLMNRYLISNRQSAPGYRHRAVIFRNLAQNGQAEKDVIRANAIEKSKLQGLLRQAQLLATKNPENAIKLIEAILKKHPTYEKAYLLRAQINYEKRQYPKALEDISRVADLNPSSEHLLLKAQWLQQAGYLNQAQGCLEKALAKSDDANRKTIELQLADIESALGLDAQAYQRYQRLLSSSADNSLHLASARCALKLGKYRLAGQHLGQVSGKLTPKLQAQYCYYAGVICRQRGQDEKAARYFIRSLAAADYSQGDSHFFLGQIYYRQQNFAEAAPHLQQAAEAFPGNAAIHELAGKCYLRHDKPEKAVASFSQCIAIEPWQASYYYQRGLAYSATREFDLAKHDLLKCQFLQPENLKPFVAVFTNIFKQNFLAGLEDLKLLFHDYFDPTYAALDTETFQPDIEKASGDYIAAALQLKQQTKQRQKWDQKKAEVFIRSLIATESASIHQMARSGLLSMDHDPELLLMLNEKLQNKRYLPRIQRRLRQIGNEISNKYLIEQKICFRQLLVRYYGAKDAMALDEIYHKGRSGIDCLCSLLTDSAEDVFIRWFAARSLLDLRQIETYLLLRQYASSRDDLTNMFANAALTADKKPTISDSSFAKMASHANPFVRSLVARCVPLTDRKILSNLFADPDHRVRVYAAARLRLTDNSGAEQVLHQLIVDKQPLVRLYAISSLWDIATLKSKLSEKEYRLRRLMYMREYLPSLATATSDSDSRVRRIAILRLGEVGPRECTKIISNHLNDKDELVRLQTVITLSIRMELDYVIPILCNPKEEFLFRAAVLLGGMQVKRKAPPQRLLTLLATLLKDPDYRLRTLLVWGMGKAGKGMGLRIVRNYLNHSDPYMRLGALCAVIDDGTRQDIPRIIKMLQDPHPETRFAAAAAAVLLSGRYHNQQALLKIDRIVQSADEHLRTGAALGYARMLYDRVKITSDNKKRTQNIKYRAFVAAMIFAVRQMDYQFYHEKTKADTFSLLKFLDYLSKAVKLSSHNARYRFERGILYYLGQQYRQSIADITAALKLKPQFPLARYWLAYVYSAAGKNRRAMTIIEQYLYDFPWDTDGLELKHRILTAQGKQKQAKEVNYRLALIKGKIEVLEDIR